MSSPSSDDNHRNFSQQVEIIRKMTPAQKLAMAQALYETAWQLKEAGLRMLHPDWSERQFKETLKNLFFYARS